MTGGCKMKFDHSLKSLIQPAKLRVLSAPRVNSP